MIVIGAGETFAGILSGFLLSRFKDTHVFFLAAAINGTFMTLFYYMPEGFPQYVCLFLAVSGIAAKFNTVYVLAELRIPPENIGAALVMMNTIAIICSAVSPFLS